MKIDKDRLKSFLDEFGVEYECYSEPRYLHEAAIAWGATNTISIRNELDFAFNDAGTFTGRLDSF